jgi:hypothetical protein
MYIPGRFLTASRPFNTLILLEVYSMFSVIPDPLGATGTLYHSGPDKGSGNCPEHMNLQGLSVLAAALSGGGPVEEECESGCPTKLH